MANLRAVLAQLQQERAQLNSQLNGLDEAIRALSGLNGTAGRGGPLGPRRRISAAGLARIRAAQKLRWAKAKGNAQARSSHPKNPATRVVSIASRRKMAAAQKARWSRWKAKQKR